jgi:hypothetical protein
VEASTSQRKTALVLLKSRHVLTLDPDVLQSASQRSVAPAVKGRSLLSEYVPPKALASHVTRSALQSAGGVTQLLLVVVHAP